MPPAAHVLVGSEQHHELSHSPLADRHPCEWTVPTYCLMRSATITPTSSAYGLYL